MDEQLQPQPIIDTKPVVVDKPKSNKFLVILLSILVLISLIIAGFFAYQTQKLTKVSKNETLTELDSLNEPDNSGASMFDVELTGNFNIGKNFKLLYITKNSDLTKETPEIGKYIIRSTYPELEEYTLLEEPYSACEIDAITMHTFNENELDNNYENYRKIHRILINSHCGDTAIRQVMGVAINKTDSKLVVLPSSEIKNIDIYPTKYYITVGWDSPDTLIAKELNFDESTGQKVTESLVKINIAPPNTITSVN